MILATDPDGDTLVYSLSGTDAASFDFNSANGQLAFISPPDYEVKNSYSVIANASDNDVTISKQLTIYVININDNTPTFITSGVFSADENQTSIGTVQATDADGDQIIYSVSGTDSSDININSSSGVLTFSSTPDYETKTSYSIVVNATDGVYASNQNVSISINNLNDNTPQITSPSSYSADENQTSVGTVQATDADGDSIIYSISGDDAGSFSIDTNSGILSFTNPPDYETKSSYAIVGNVSDGTNTSEGMDIVINVNDVNEAPAFTTTVKDFSYIDGYLVANSPVGVNFSVVDPDGNGGDYGRSPSSYLTISGSDAGILNGWSTDESSSPIKIRPVLGSNIPFATPTDSNQDNVYQYTITSTENFGLLTASEDFSITVLKGNSSLVNVYSGSSFSSDLSDNGLVAATAYNNVVKVFEYSGGTWSQKGSDISHGLAGTPYAGETGFSSVALDNDGDTLIVGIPSHDNSKGTIRIYTYNGSSWIQDTGITTTGNWDNEEVGESVKINNSGDTIMVTSLPNFNATSNALARTRVFQKQFGSWGDLNAENFSFLDADGFFLSDKDDNSGLIGSIDMNNDGTIIAIGAPGKDDEAENAGQVQVYQLSTRDYDGSTLNGPKWSMYGRALNGSNAQESFGHQVSLSGDGSTLVVSTYSQSPNLYQAKIYKYDPTLPVTPNGALGSWTLYDTLSLDSGEGNMPAVSVSNDGSRVAITSLGRGNTQYVGYTEVYFDDNGTFRLLDSRISGVGNHSRPGTYNGLEISGDGTRVLINSPANSLPAGSPRLDSVDLAPTNPNCGDWCQ